VIWGAPEDAVAGVRRCLALIPDIRCNKKPKSRRGVVNAWLDGRDRL